MNVAVDPPIVTLVIPMKLLPVIVTVWPPDVGPLIGLMLFIVGWGDVGGGDGGTYDDV